MILLLRSSTRRAGQAVPQLVVLLLLLVHVVNVLWRVDLVHLSVADKLIDAGRPRVVLGLVYVVVAEIGVAH